MNFRCEEKKELGLKKMDFSAPKRHCNLHGCRSRFVPLTGAVVVLAAAAAAEEGG